VTEEKTEAELDPRVQIGNLSAFEDRLHLHGSRLRAFVAMKLPFPHLVDEIALSPLAHPQTRQDRRHGKKSLNKQIPITNEKEEQMRRMTGIWARMTLGLLVAFWVGCESGPPAEEVPSTPESGVQGEATANPGETPEAEQKEAPAEVREIRFGVVPQQAPSQILRNWKGFAKEMSKRTGWKWTVKTAPSIPEFEERCLDGQYDIAYMNPYHYTVFAQKPGYKAFARQKNKQIKGILVVRKDSPVETIAGLKDARVAFPSPAAFAASVVTRTYLRNEGIPVEVNYANSHDSVYANVANKIHEAGGGVMRTWNATSAEVRDQLEILWTSPAYTPHAFAHHPRLTDEEVKTLQKAVSDLEAEPRDSAVFDPIRFNGLTAGQDGDWDDVRALKITELDSLLEGK
jgi:phosphonate transport system substrate-binding protein